MLKYLFIFLAVVMLPLAIWAIIYAAKENKIRDAFYQTLTEEQKQRLASAETVMNTSAGGGFTTDGIIREIIEKNGKYFLSVVFHNRAVKNRWFDKPMMLNIPVTKAEIDAHNLKPGDYVRFFTDYYEPDPNQKGGFVGGMESAQKKKAYVIFNEQ